MFDEVDAGDICPPVRVHDDEVVVSAVLCILAQPVREAAALVLAEEAVRTGQLVVGGVQVKLHHVCLDCASVPGSILGVRHET